MYMCVCLSIKSLGRNTTNLPFIPPHPPTPAPVLPATEQSAAPRAALLPSSGAHPAAHGSAGTCEVSHSPHEWFLDAWPLAGMNEAQPLSTEQAQRRKLSSPAVGTPVLLFVCLLLFSDFYLFFMFYYYPPPQLILNIRFVSGAQHRGYIFM